MEHKKALIAACPGAGKTRMTLKVLEQFRAKFPESTILIFCHGQTLLREQWAGVIEKNSPLDFRVVRSNKDLKNSKGKLLVAIPQTTFNAEKLPKIDLLVVDEAHHYCEADSTKNLIDRINAKYELRLTGTPSIYIGRDEWKLTGVTVQELLEYDVLTDPVIELIKSDYKYGLSDYFETLNLKSNVSFSKESTFKTLDAVLERLHLKLKNKKTMYVCHDQQQARDVSEYFNKTGIKNILSISDISDGIEEVEKFKRDPSIHVFVVVNRGTLGFDFDKLTALIDLSGSLNVNKLFQMLCRVVRKDSSNPSHKKYFIKLSTQEMAPITHFVMSFVVSLSDPKYYYTYKTEDTKNSRVPVPAGLLEAISRLSGGKRSGAAPRDFADLPALFTFRDIKNIRDGVLETYAMTDFSTVRRMLSYQARIQPSIDRALEAAKKCKNRYEFRMNYKNEYAFLHRNGFLHLIDSFLPPRYFRKSDWTVEEVLELASKFKTKSKFREAHHGAFKWLKSQKKLGFLNFETKFRRWDEKTAIKAALKFENNNRIQALDQGLYCYLTQHKLLSVVTKMRLKKTDPNDFVSRMAG